MKKNRNIVLKLVSSLFVMVFMIVTQTHAVENSSMDMVKSNDMPPAPAGPYRSTHNSNKFAPVEKFDNRQWTPPAPSHWVQQQRRQGPMRQPVPPQWVQQQRKQGPMRRPVPPPWVVQQQRRQLPMRRPVPPPWIQQRRQVPMQRPVPPLWMQQRSGIPPVYARPPVWGNAPYSQYRR